jgi:hypothetical protein
VRGGTVESEVNTLRRALFVFIVVTLLVGIVQVARADRPVFVTFCHVAGLAEDPANTVTLTLPENAVYGEAGHFNENGTPKAGHEQDYLGPCQDPESTGPTGPGPTGPTGPGPTGPTGPGPTGPTGETGPDPTIPPGIGAGQPQTGCVEPSVTFGPWYGDPRINITLEGPGSFVVKGGIQRSSDTRVFRVTLECGEEFTINRYKVKFGKRVYVYLNGTLFASRRAPRV